MVDRSRGPLNFVGSVSLRHREKRFTKAQAVITRSGHRCLRNGDGTRQDRQWINSDKMIWLKIPTVEAYQATTALWMDFWYPKLLIYGDVLICASSSPILRSIVSAAQLWLNDNRAQICLELVSLHSVWSGEVICVKMKASMRRTRCYAGRKYVRSIQRMGFAVSFVGRQIREGSLQSSLMAMSSISAVMFGVRFGFR